MPLAIGTRFPSLDGATEWLNETFASEDAPGRPTLVQFWAMSCPVCKINVPRLLGLLNEYSTHGLRLVSIHMPRGPHDMDVEKVRTASQELGLTGPCAVDNEHALGDLFQTGKVWPCYLLYDANGKLRSRAAGVLGLKMAENSLRRMLEPIGALVAAD